MIVSDELTNDLNVFLEKYQVAHAILLMPLQDNSIQIVLSNVTTEQLRQISSEITRLLIGDLRNDRGVFN